MKNDRNVIVTIRCATFNHGAYIRQTLEGFVMQQTNFRFEVLVHDDASTDNTVEIIREYATKYPDIIKTCYEQENQYSKNPKVIDKWFATNTRGKYLAICEGDDFWIDAHKLQKQVDFLENNLDYNLVCHNWNVYNDAEYAKSPIHDLYVTPFTFTFSTLPWIWITKTLTLLIRTSALNFSLISRYSYCRDVHYVYHALKEGKGYYMPEVMATYRIHPGGVWSEHDDNERNKTTYGLYKELYQFEKTKAVRKRYMNATLAYYNGLAFGKGTWYHFIDNVKLYFEALRNISDAKDIVFCVGGLVPTKLIKWVMKSFKV